MLADHPRNRQAPRRTILIVDDDQAVREALKFTLELEGMSVRACGSGKLLLQHPELASADCLVIDYKMPEMDGLAVLEALKKRGISVPAILITSALNKDIERQAIARGVAGILEKPLVEDVLLKAICHILPQ